ncbi:MULTISPECIES: phage tail protein [Moraxella]|uniref:Phage tail fiber protein n=1 Tax=Moraxella catarrhalis TaxID=480 RepID=A0A7Z0UXS0_MORCA|nr:phage tail protein [Moraxella catarrhalis]OAV00222.1 Phage tail fiber protein [Moraxella catarrhalis]STY82491.1 Phage tail fibre repeat [Moraxella catarrhalis]
MSTYYTIITNIGKEQFATASQNATKVTITHLALGDGGGVIPTPSADRTALIAEKVRVNVNQVEPHHTNRNWIEIHAIIPSGSGGYTVREIGLYAGNTLIAIGSFPATYKPSATEGSAREMSIRVVIAVENASVINVTLDNSLVYVTRKWAEDNFVNHNEVINTLSATDTNKPLSAAQGKALQDNKAEKTTNITAGNGLTGGGTLQANRTLTLGTPSQITATSTNAVTATSHTHAIDKATDAQAGVVMLSHLTDGTDKSKAASEYALGEVRRLANQAQVSIDGIALTWSNIENKPATYPPATHTHSWDSITGKPSSFNPSHHTHPWSQITGVPSASTSSSGVVMLSHLTDGTDKSKAASEYALGEVRRLANQAQASANGISLTWDSITGKPSLFPPSSHTHTISQISGLQSELNNKANANHIHHWNDITNKPSSFNPSHHTHPWSQITGVPSASTSSSGVVLLSNSLSNSSTTQAATANTVKLLNDNKLDKTNVITNASQITTGDLNNYTRPGYYYCSSGSHATNIRNTPVNRAFSLEITQTDGVIQTFKEAHNANVWIRTYNSYWDEWKKLAATTDNVSSATRLQNARTISLTGALSGSASFDGSSNISLYSTIRTATTSVAGIVQLNNSTDSTSTTQAATANALKSAYDLAFAADNNANRRVSRNGSETIYGVKTFDASPKAPTPHFATNDTTVATTAFVKSQISVLTGTINHGGTLPLPSGYSESQCRFMVSVNKDNPDKAAWDINENGWHFHYGFECWANGRVVHVGAYLGNYGSRTNFVAGVANYIVIGVR